MVISYHGVEAFRVQFGDTILSFNPVSKDSKYKPTNFGSDITLVSVNHPDMNGDTSRGEKESFRIDSPGEYEVKGVVIKGLSSTSKLGLNTIYTVNLENMNLCFLGALSSPNLPTEAKESIDGVDILFVPIGGEGVLNPAEAYKLAVSLEPAIIIPMSFDEKSLKAFLKEGGGEGAEAQEKLTIKKKDLEGKEGEIVVLKEQ